MTVSSRLKFINILLLFCIWRAGSLSQELQHEVVVTLKLVQVYVTDSEGNPVTDLGKSDFNLYDNGKNQKITDFESHNLLKAQPLGEYKPGRSVQILGEAATPRITRKFFLLIDYEQNDTRGIAKSKDAARQFVETQMRPGDEIAVLTYSSIRGIVVHEYLQNDPKKIIDAISNLKDVPGKSRDEPGLSPRRLFQEGDIGADATAFFSDRSSTEWGREDEIFKTRLYIQEIRDLAGSLRYIPGNKNIVLFSTGIKATLLLPVYDSFTETALDQYEDMTRELAAASCPVYAVDSSGALERFQSRADRGQQSLRLLSEKTGGQYFNDVTYASEIVTQIHQITAHYYVLGYPVDEKWDGKFHELRVEVKRRGCLVHSPSGYFNPKPFAEYSGFEKQLHLIDLAMSEKPAQQERLSFPLLALPWLETAETRVVLLSAISREDLREVLKGKGELFTLDWNQEKRVFVSSKGEINPSVLGPETMYLYSDLTLPPGRYEVRLVLRNAETGRGALGSFWFDTSKHQDSGFLMYPPLLLMPDKTASYFSVKDIREKKAAPSLKDIYLGLPKEAAPIVGRLDGKCQKFLGAFRFSLPEGQKPNLKFHALLREITSQEILPLDYSALFSRQEGDTMHMLIEFLVPELKPGRYALECGAEDKNLGLESIQITQLEVT